MVLKVIALVLFSAALLIVLVFGYGWPVAAMIHGINPTALTSMQTGVSRLASAQVWDSLFAPLLFLPAWMLPMAFGLILFLIAALRPGKG